MTQVYIPWTTASSLIGEISIGHFITAVKRIHNAYHLDLKAAKFLADALRDGYFSFETLDGIRYVVTEADITRIALS